MSGKNGNFLDRLLQQRTLARWDRAARLAPSLDVGELQRMRTDARLLWRDVAKVLHEADGRLCMRLDDGDGIDRPLGCDWAWRPELWCGPLVPSGIASVQNRTMLGTEVTLFHDCPKAEISLRQVRNSVEQIAPFGVALEVYDFAGGMLSLSLDLPEDLLRGLRRNHLVRLAMSVNVEHQAKIFCRLNIRHGPNTAQTVREMPLSSGSSFVDFDLSGSKLNEKRLEKAWIDLIFDQAEMNRIVLNDLYLVRHPRAEI